MRKSCFGSGCHLDLALGAGIQVLAERSEISPTLNYLAATAAQASYQDPSYSKAAIAPPLVLLDMAAALPPSAHLTRSLARSLSLSTRPSSLESLQVESVRVKRLGRREVRRFRRRLTICPSRSASRDVGEGREATVSVEVAKRRGRENENAPRPPFQQQGPPVA